MEENKNISNDHGISIQNSKNAMATKNQFQGVPIEGFERLPMSMMALPFVVITQALTDVYLKDGKTPAPKGKWYFSDIAEVTDELHFIPLAATVIEKEQQKDDGTIEKRPKLRCLCANMEDSELFIMSLSVTSFTAWGKMIAQLKKSGISVSYAHEWVGTIKQAVNKRGQKFYIADFVLGSELHKDDLAKMADLAAQYGGVVDRSDLDEDVIQGE